MSRQQQYIPVFPAAHGQPNRVANPPMPRPMAPPVCPQEFPHGTPLLYFDERTRSIVSDIPTELKHYDHMSGKYKAPPGYSFVWLESLSPTPTPSTSPVNMLVPMQTLSLKARSRSVTPEPEHPKKPSKHDKIESLLQWLETRFGEEGANIYNQMKQAEGSHVLRVDIKTIAGVDLFPSVLKDICNEVTVSALSTRSSLKRNKQRKGLSVYMKVATAQQKQQVMAMLEEHCEEQATWIVKEIQPKE